ncbi:MAG: hypothetical protein KDB00_15745, partial [Planctomycetales bacterium]|nr:hypothetical protein [Planctomycetales bacterium]
LQQYLPERPVTPPEGLSIQQYEEQIQREDAVKKIQKWLVVSTPKNGYTVAVKANGPDAMLVQAITQTVMEQYKKYHVEAHRADGSMEFFEQQVDQSKQMAVDAREQLQKARSESGWMSIESAETTLRDRIVNLEISLDEAESQYAESNQRAVALKDQLARTKEWIPTEITKGVANVAGDSMRTQLFGEQVQESEQLATLKPTHPRYRMLQEKMSRSTEIAAGESDMRELTREALNPIWQQLESEYSLASAGAEGLKSKCESLRSSLQKTRDELLRLNHDSVDLARLRWQADIAEESLKDHAKSLEEARIIFELDRKNISDVTVIQNASLNLKKSGPPRSVLAVLGALVGLGLGVLQALLRYTPRPTMTYAISFEAGSLAAESNGRSGHRNRLAERHAADLEESETIEQQEADAPMVASASHEKVLPR